MPLATVMDVLAMKVKFWLLLLKIFSQLIVNLLSHNGWQITGLFSLLLACCSFVCKLFLLLTSTCLSVSRSLLRSLLIHLRNKTQQLNNIVDGQLLATELCLSSYRLGTTINIAHVGVGNDSVRQRMTFTGRKEHTWEWTVQCRPRRALGIYV